MTATSITTELYLPDHIPDLPAALRQALYRAAQEALTNIQRHAHANHVQIRVALLGDEKIADGLIDTEILISIADNGRGLAEGESTRGYGLRGLEERATELGGKVTIQPHCGGGTRVVMTLPLPLSMHQPVTPEAEASND
jgi:signal transduction histidine kinase